MPTAFFGLKTAQRDNGPMTETPGTRLRGAGGVGAARKYGLVLWLVLKPSGRGYRAAPTRRPEFLLPRGENPVSRSRSRTAERVIRRKLRNGTTNHSVETGLSFHFFLLFAICPAAPRAASRV